MLISDRVLDGALERLRAESTHVYLCNAEPTTFSQATTTYALGVKNFGANNAWGAPAARTPNGRKTTATAVTDGTVSVGGSGAFVAYVDSVNSRLLATFPVASPQTVYIGNPWTANAFDYGHPNQ